MVASNPNVLLLLLEIQGVGPGWAALSELLETVSKTEAGVETLALETAYPAADQTLLAFLTGSKQSLDQALEYIKKSSWNSYLSGSIILHNSAAIVSAAHHLQVPGEVKNLIIVESNSAIELASFADQLPPHDIFEIHFRKLGLRGGWIYATSSEAALAAAKSAPGGIKTTVIAELSRQLEPFF